MKRKFFSSCFITSSWLIYSLLIALSVWTQTYPQELKSLILNRSISNPTIVLSFIKYLIWFFAALGFVNTALALLKFSQQKKRFSWINSFVDQAKASWPIFLLIFYPSRAFVLIGDQPAWFEQTTSYFLIFFIFVLGLAFYNLLKTLNILKLSFFSLGRIKIWLWSIFILSVLFWGYFSVLRSLDLSIEKPDSHVFVSVLWNSAKGNFLRFAYLDGPRSWFSLHFEPLMFLFVPLYLIKIPEMLVPILLQLIQVVIGASGVFPVFLLARKKLGSNFLGLILASVYLLFPAFQFQILYDFHIEIISLVTILWSIYFLELKRYKPFLFFLALAIFSREEFALYASLFGLYLLFKKGDSRKLGILLLPAGFFYLLLVKSLILPYFGQGELVPAQVGMYAHLGENLSQIAKTFFFKSEYVLNFMFTQRKVQYLFLMFLPTGFLALLSPLVLFSLPFFAINLLLNFDLPSSIFWHYQSWLIPILIWATLDFISKKERIKFALCGLIFLVSLLSSLYFGPFNLLNLNLGNTHKGLLELKKSLEIDYLKDIQKLIPNDGVLAADTSLAPYFANRKDFYLFPNQTDTDYIVTSLKQFKNHPQLHSFLIKSGYCLKVIEGILVYKEGKGCESLWQDELMDTNQPISLSFPISPKKLNLPTVLTIESSFEENIYSKNTIYLLDYEMLARAPSIVKIEASFAGKNYQTVTTCSSFTDSYCIGRSDISNFVNKEGAIYLKFYIFADSLVSKKPIDVKIERLSLRSLKLAPNSK